MGRTGVGRSARRRGWRTTRTGAWTRCRRGERIVGRRVVFATGVCQDRSRPPTVGRSWSTATALTRITATEISHGVDADESGAPWIGDPGAPSAGRWLDLGLWTRVATCFGW